MRVFAQILLLCVCVAAVNTCPKRKLVTTETQTSAVQRVDIVAESSSFTCSEGMSQTVFHETYKTGGSVSPASTAIVFSLNLLNNAPGMAFYLPPGPPSSLNTDIFPLFLKNGVLIV